MKIKVFILLTSFVVLVALYLFVDKSNLLPVSTFASNTKIGKIDIGGLTWEDGYTLLLTRLNSPIYLNFEDSSRAITLSSIGIGLDRDKLEKLTISCRYKFLSALSFFCKKTSNETIRPVDIITTDKGRVDSFLTGLENEIKNTATNTIISFSDYSFTKPSLNAKIYLDKSQFEDKQLLLELIDKEPVRIKIRTISTDDTEKQNASTQNLILDIQTPLLIKYGRNPVYIPEDNIKNFLETETRNEILYGKINKSKVLEYLDEIGAKYERNDVKLIKSSAAESIQRALLLRSADYEINTAVILPIEGLPKTNGELHDAYLEIVKSQQRLYRFENGRLVKEYIISTGLTWETPPGEFSVLGKQKMTISYFGNWYMPNYLPIGTVNGYRFGFHAIPYHLDAGGNIYSRDPNTMGSPATGGCIQLAAEDSLELFDWAKIGTPVYIYE